MSVDPSAPMTFVDEDASSGSGDDVNTLDGKKRQSGMPSSSGRRKRSRKATGDAIVDAMLEIAAASKMRAAAIMKNEDRFSISKCIKVLDEMQDMSAGLDDFDLELDEMELIAAAAGYYYYKSITRQPVHSLSPRGGCGFMTEVLNGHDELCREMFRMDKHVFHKLSDILRQRGMLRDTAGVMIEEQLAIFLNIVGHNERNRVIQERFQHSGETISRHFNNVLKAIKSLSREFLQPPPFTTHQEILKNHRDIVIAACVIHNYIRYEEEKDWLFSSMEGMTVDELPDLDEQPDIHLVSTVQEQVAFSMRDSIAAAMWDDFINKWEECFEPIELMQYFTLVTDQRLFSGMASTSGLARKGVELVWWPERAGPTGMPCGDVKVYLEPVWA
ncbi:hypothetical protein FEM48_Zijuj04G0203000 [Ziziphus jujuba var. spinosa]|uniref:DUF8040 domain-containing protein n=1 Tax=Ziziphus jujuba var. spinosa TaxID=714518 RepID=A0A978VLZ6_ZIZJJ|nr:hypothetical protein FEM48_Zijuj04G0203000 [Ziziphus jujuba var. spinosa]